MVVRSEKNRIKALVTDTITLLCKNGLQTSSGFSIEGVIGITSLDDEDDVFIIPIKEIIKNMPEKASSESESESPSSACKRKRKRRRKSSQLDSENIPHEQSISPDPHLLKHEIESDSNSNDVVMVKEEPSTPRLYSNISLHTEQNTQMNNIGDVSHSHLYGSSQMFTPSPSSQWSSSNNAHLFATMPHPPPRTVNPQFSNAQTAMMTNPQTEDFSKYTSQDMRVIANRIASSEGMFLTVRLVKRRVCRYPTNFIIKTMKEYMTRSPDHPLYMGEYREPPRTKVFYKCPPQLIKDDALKLMSVSREAYMDMFHSVPKVQKWDKPEIQGRLLLSVVEASPYKNYYKPEIVEPLINRDGKKNHSHQSWKKVCDQSKISDSGDIPLDMTQRSAVVIGARDKHCLKEQSNVLGDLSCNRTTNAAVSNNNNGGFVVHGDDSLSDHSLDGFSDVQKSAEIAIMQKLYTSEQYAAHDEQQKEDV